MKSIYRLHSFIQNNHHQILNLYVFDQKLIMIRLISNRSGEIFFLSLGKYEIKLNAEDGFEPFIQNHCYYMEIAEEESPSVSEYFDSIFALHPELNKQIVIIRDHHLYQSPDVVYELINFPSKETVTFYFIVTLEWFYENSLTIDHFIQKKKNLFMSRFYHLFSTSKQEIHRISTYFEKADPHFLLKEKAKYNECHARLTKTKKLGTIIFQHLEKLYEEQDQIMEQEAFTSFQDSLQKSFKKQKIQQDLRKMQQLKDKTLERISFYYELESDQFLKILLYLTEFTIILSKLYNFFMKFGS